jgi:hypothetical protein
MWSQQQFNIFSIREPIFFFQKKFSFDSGTEKSVCYRFQGFLVFQEIRCGPCANSLQAYAEQCVQDVHGNLTVIPDGPLEGRVASSVSGIACIFNNQMWFVSQLLSRHGVNNLCRIRTET